MSLSMYQVTVPLLVRSLTNLSAILQKAAAYQETKNIKPGVLENSRLAPDMYPLTKQVQIATDIAKGCAARLAGVDVPSYADTESNFTELQQRLQKTIDFIKGFNAADMDGSEEKAIQLKFGPTEYQFNGRDYVLDFVLPNVYFHVSMAYAILRHNGLEIGKKDFLGA